MFWLLAHQGLSSQWPLTQLHPVGFGLRAIVGLIPGGLNARTPIFNNNFNKIDCCLSSPNQILTKTLRSNMLIDFK